MENMDKDYCKASIKALNNLLSDEFVLMTKALNFHWNVSGPHFMANHEFFEKIYREAFTNVDDVAERVRIVAGRPIASLKGFLSHNRIKEYPEDQDVPSVEEMYRILAEDYETIIHEVTQDLHNLEKCDCGDEGTLAFLQDFVARSQKTCWMIKMYLK